MLSESNKLTQLKSFDEELPSSIPESNPEFSLMQLPRSYGNMKKVWVDQNGNPRYLLGPHYPIFLTALAVCSGLLIMMIMYYYEKMSFFWNAMLILFSAAFIGCYIKIGFSLPGIAHASRIPTQQQRQSPRFCPRCQLVRERKTEHCGDCDVCIIQADHHCPWIGKCVGRDNLCLFYMFLCSTFGTMLLCFLATAVGAVVNVGSINSKPNPGNIVQQ